MESIKSIPLGARFSNFVEHKVIIPRNMYQKYSIQSIYYFIEYDMIKYSAAATSVLAISLLIYKMKCPENLNDIHVIRTYYTRSKKFLYMKFLVLPWQLRKI